MEHKEMSATEEIQAGVNYQEWSGVDQIESLCMSCGENGVTRLMLHKIPYFRELIIASFHCPHCDERNNEVSFGGEIQLQGCIYELKITCAKDLDRQLIKSDSASVLVKELDFEIPPKTQKGEISTIEGVLRTAAKNLGLHQAERMIDNPVVGAKVAEIITKLSIMAGGLSDDIFPFHIVVDDPAGNSFVENTHAPQQDPNMTIRHYFRTAEQDRALGLNPESSSLFRDDKDSNFKALMGEHQFGAADSTSANTAEVEVAEEGDKFERLGRSEVISIPSNCPNCQALGESLTALTDIPHFKEVIIMAFDCKTCGFRNNEVKGGGAVPALGTEVALTVSNLDDLKRDLLKSDSASVAIPELELELQHGTLGGVFTTVEGLLQKIHGALVNSNPFAVGDSSVLQHSQDPAVIQRRANFQSFLDSLQDCAQGRRFPITVVLRDPLGNSFISAPLGSFLPPEMDKALTIRDFERTYDENEDFGLNDINTRDFETGVDHEAPILPDRLTHPHVQGPDHPTFFAKGTNVNDTTAPASGAAFAPEMKPSDEDRSADNDQYFKPPPGWSFEKSHAEEAIAAPQTLEPPKRYFNDDCSLQYIPREEFGGYRAGFVFRLGSQGLGYYEDRGQGACSE